MDMESTPDSGVEIKKAVVAPLLAPCLRSDTAAGKTPHDHNGMGMPKNAALKTTELANAHCANIRLVPIHKL